jgi:hypothetical protein
MTTIFKVEPKTFPTPSDFIGQIIKGVSTRINTSDIGNETTYPFSFVFYSRDLEGNWIPEDGADIPVRVIINLPNNTTINLVSLLFSPNRVDRYYAASIIASSRGYKLLPIEEQDTLLDVI